VQLKDYQLKVIERLDAYLAVLRDKREDAQTIFDALRAKGAVG